ncbi:ABC transporter ATP-binding protein [Alicyclobacillus curvatus]|nr:ABC transporter ATP-binding protein [Alicyclobacillus curvatus]
MLAVKDASVSYADFQVLQNVSLTLEQGVFHSLIGPNGAGKTTLIGALSGHLHLTSGAVFYEGQNVTKWRAHRRTRSGIGRSFQKTNLFPTLTVLQNVELAVLGTTTVRFRNLLGKVPESVTNRAMDALRQVTLEKHLHTRSAALSHGDKRKLELAMLLSQGPRVLLLDEPTAGMSIAEAGEVLQLIDSLRVSGEYAILLVEHKLDAVMQLSDVVTVLASGEVLASGSPDEIMNNPDVERAYLGGSHGNRA